MHASTSTCTCQKGVALQQLTLYTPLLATESVNCHIICSYMGSFSAQLFYNRRILVLKRSIIITHSITILTSSTHSSLSQNVLHLHVAKILHLFGQRLKKNYDRHLPIQSHLIIFRTEKGWTECSVLYMYILTVRNVLVACGGEVVDAIFIHPGEVGGKVLHSGVGVG